MTKEDYDLNNDGVIDAEERAIMLEDKRRRMEDNDADRDSKRRMAWFALAGFLLFPFSVILTEWLGLPDAGKLLADMSSLYYLSVSALLGAYFGFTTMDKK